MSITAMTAMVVMVGTGALAEETVPILETLNNPEVRAAMRTAWIESAAGTSGMETAFRLDGGRSDYRVVATRPTNQFMSQTISINRGETFAVFHVHPARSRPDPSGTDRAIADKYKLKIVTMHVLGLYQYDPVTRKTTRLREGLDWISPVQNQRGD
jgi:hypothetical protein